MADFEIKVKFGDFEKKLRAAIDRGLVNNRQLKTIVEAETKKAIESVLVSNQDLFRPDKGPDGGDDLIGFLGIGEDGREDTDKIATAWHFLLPKLRGDNKNFSSQFQKKKNKFGIIKYNINLEKFYTSPKSVYTSSKDGDSDIEIKWMKQLMDGVPTTEVRDNPNGADYVFLPSSRSGRAGHGRMVDKSRIKIPTRQFDFNGRGSREVFNKIFSELGVKFSSANFKGQITKAINKAFRS